MERTQESMQAEYMEIRKRVEFDLLKDVIMDSLELDYVGDSLRIGDERLIIKFMELIEPDDMIGLLNHKKAEKEARKNG